MSHYQQQPAFQHIFICRIRCVAWAVQFLLLPSYSAFVFDENSQDEDFNPKICRHCFGICEIPISRGLSHKLLLCRKHRSFGGACVSRYIYMWLVNTEPKFPIPNLSLFRIGNAFVCLIIAEFNVYRTAVTHYHRISHSYRHHTLLQNQIVIFVMPGIMKIIKANPKRLTPLFNRQSV